MVCITNIVTWNDFASKSVNFYIVSCLFFTSYSVRSLQHYDHIRPFCMSYFQKGVNPLDSVIQNHSWKDQPPLDAPLPVALRYFYISQSAAQIKVDNNKEELLWFVDVYYSAPELARRLFITTDCSSLNLYPSRDWGLTSLSCLVYRSCADSRGYPRFIGIKCIIRGSAWVLRHF